MQPLTLNICGAEVSEVIDDENEPEQCLLCQSKWVWSYVYVADISNTLL